MITVIPWGPDPPDPASDPRDRIISDLGPILKILQDLGQPPPVELVAFVSSFGDTLETEEIASLLSGFRHGLEWARKRDSSRN